LTTYASLEAVAEVVIMLVVEELEDIEILLILKHQVEEVLLKLQKLFISELLTL
jgi:hypothetical protein|tara:strand:- start:540 stop:701 length:162 start_codon:yes stop_codon:yes gene_type:complete